jgi:hypothetical protein
MDMFDCGDNLKILPVSYTDIHGNFLTCIFKTINIHHTSKLKFKRYFICCTLNFSSYNISLDEQGML